MRTSLGWLVLACLLPGIIGAVILFFHEYREERAQLEKDNIQTARALVQAVDSHLQIPQAVAETLAESLTSILQAQGFPSDWPIAVLDAAGTFVARTQAPEQFIGQPAPRGFLERIRQTPEGSMETTAPDGIPVISIYSRSPRTGWTVSIGIPRHTLEADLKDGIATLALGIACLFAIGLSLAWYLGERIARSVRSLNAPVLMPEIGAPAPAPAFFVREVAEVAALLREHTRALLDSEIRFRATFEQAAVGIAHIALDGGWLRVNDRLCTILGQERGALLKLNFQDITYPPDLKVDLDLARQLIAGEIPSYTIEKRYVRQDGSLVWANLTVALVRTGAGAPDYAIAVIEDIGRRKNAEIALLEHQEQLAQRSEALLRANRELRAANEQLEGFLQASSHDLKGPLGRIGNFSSLLEKHYRDRLEGDGLLFLDFIRSNALRLTALIDDLSNHARVERLASRLQPVDLPDAVQEALLEMTEPLRKTGAAVRLGLPRARILANPLALHQVLRNLLENALKFSAKGAEPLIEIGGGEQAGRFRLWIRDNGIGFDMKYHDRIFDIFRRLHTYDEYAGTGVGLALVKRAMEHMGGRVWAESELERGATFYLDFEATL